MRFSLAFSPLVVFLMAWQAFVANDPRLKFLFGSPAQIVQVAISDLQSQDFFLDVATTAAEAIFGLLVGVSAGFAIGILSFLSKPVFQLSRPYVTALSAVPVFTLAPVLIMWFGTGMYSRIVMTGGAVVFFSVAETWRLLKEAEARHNDWLVGLGISRSASITWVYLGEAGRLSLGTAFQAIPYAMAGSFVAEFVISQHGLGRYILAAGGLYDVSRVFFGIIVFMCLALTIRALLARLARAAKVSI